MPTADPNALSPLVFNVDYYKSYNQLTQLTDAEAKTQWLSCGVNQGLRAHPLFWAPQYLQQFSTQPNTFSQAIDNYVGWGYVGSGGGLRNGGQSGVLALNPAVYDIRYYTKTHPQFSENDVGAEVDWIENGIPEGAPSAPWFSVKDYLFFNQDKALEFGNHHQAAINDYVPTTLLQVTSSTLPTSTSAVFNTLVFEEGQYHWPHWYAANGGTFDWNAPGYYEHYYPEAANYSDWYVKQSLLTPYEASWWDKGLAAGQKGSPQFSAKEYMQMNPGRFMTGPPNYESALKDYIYAGRALGLPGLVQINTDFMDYVPFVRQGITLHPLDKAASFTAPDGKNVKIIVRAPTTQPANVMTVIAPADICGGQAYADDYFNTVSPKAEVKTFQDSLTVAMNGAYSTLKLVSSENGSTPPCNFVFQGSYINNGGHVNMPRIHDLAVDFSGAAFNFSQPQAGFSLNGDLTRVILENFVIDWPHERIASIGTIENDSHGNPMFKITRSYPDLGSAPIPNGDQQLEMVSSWDAANNTWGPDNYDVGINSPIGTGICAVYSQAEGGYIYQPDQTCLNGGGNPFNNQQIPLHTVALGKHFYYEGTGIGNFGSNSTITDLQIVNAQINAAPGMGMSFVNVTGLLVDGYKLIRPDGRIISATADGIDIAGTGDVILENSEISFNGDDCINQGTNSMLQPASYDPAQGTVVVYPVSGQQAPAQGDTVMFLNSAVAPLGFAQIQSVTVNKANGNYHLAFNGPLPATFGMDSYVQDMSGLGVRYLIQNNKMHDSSGRGFITQSPLGMVTGNQIYGTVSPPISLASVMTEPGGQWGIGIHDVIVSNNHIVSQPGPQLAAAGAVQITNFLTNEFLDGSGGTDVPVNSNIILEKNDLENLPGSAFFISSASNVTIRNNVIANANLQPGFFVGTANTSGSMVISQAHNITISGNQVSGALTGPVSVDTHSTSGIVIEQAENSSPSFTQNTFGGHYPIIRSGKKFYKPLHLTTP